MCHMYSCNIACAEAVLHTARQYETWQQSNMFELDFWLPLVLWCFMFLEIIYVHAGISGDDTGSPASVCCGCQQSRSDWQRKWWNKSFDIITQWLWGVQVPPSLTAPLSVWSTALVATFPKSFSNYADVNMPAEARRVWGETLLLWCPLTHLNTPHRQAAETLVFMERKKDHSSFSN